MFDLLLLYLLVGVCVFVLNAYEFWWDNDSSLPAPYRTVWPIVTGLLWLPLIAFSLCLVVWLKISGTKVKGNIPSVEDFR